MITALMYHDVVLPGREDESGFKGPDAARYKVSRELFASHLTALEHTTAMFLTFDDGGITAMHAAWELERHGRCGCFFVTSDYIGTDGFLHQRDIRELVSRGHMVGSHSCSHPLRMGHCTRAQLIDEWTRSREILESIAGLQIRYASVPGGDFSAAVADTAAEAGYTQLFTSEPTNQRTRVKGLEIHGRYTIRNSTSPAAVAALARGAWFQRAQQRVIWSAKKITKRIAGTRYLSVRRLALGCDDSVVWGDPR